jgi:adenylate cyclase
MRLNLRKKLLFFAITIAIIPLVVSGGTIIRIAQDELKSSANDQLVTTAKQLADEIDDLYERSWLAPLLLIRNALDDPGLGVEEKIALLTQGLAAIPDIVALQITVEQAPVPLVMTKDDFSARIGAASLDPLEVLRVPIEAVEELSEQDNLYVREVSHVAKTDDWLATVVLPLEGGLAGQAATLSARIDLANLRRWIQSHPFTKTGLITVVDSSGRKIFDPARPDLSNYDIVSEATGLLASGARTISVEPYTRPDGEVMLGAFSFPHRFSLGIIVEKPRADAYLAIRKMIKSLGYWVLIGLGVAIAGAILFALAISRPILEMGRVAVEVAKGNFRERVHGATSKDEIGDLGRRMNDMIVGLNERFQLEKFVSSGTLAAIRLAQHQGVRLGGERRRATMLFCDIRGYTSFAEQRDPEVVVEVLNFYFQRLADFVAKHGGDIDKFVGDQILAVFLGEDMERNAVRCALRIQGASARLARERPDWDLALGIGINAGEVVMGAMGSQSRMDYTVLGDNVNQAARLCAQAGPGQTLLTETVWLAVADGPEFAAQALAPIIVKGKSEPVTVYEVRSTMRPRAAA